MNIIEVENLSHRFPDGTLGLVDINLAIPKGTLVIVAGENGSGKTTFLKHLNGLLRPNTGTVRLAGLSVSRDIVRARQLVGMVFQNADSQIVGETVCTDVAFGPENLGLSRSEVNQRVTEALEAVDLTSLAQQRPHLLSGGEKRRLSIAAVLAMNPQVIALDEPFSSLDYPGVKQVLHHILALHETGHTILVTTHDVEKIIAHADRLIIMKSGRIVRDGIPSEVIKEAEVFGVREPCSSRLGMGINSWLN
jgi:biotin transport system ATP-binding protein